MANETGWIFFDRGLVDAAVALQHATGQPARGGLASFDRYHHCVFLTPPWPEIFVTDNERQHGLAEAVAEYDRLLTVYGRLGCKIVVLPRVGVSVRADFLLRHLR